MQTTHQTLHRLAWVTGLAAVMAAVGCATPQGKFQTQVDPASPPQPLGKVLLAYYVQPNDVSVIIGEDFSERFVARLASRLAQRGVAAETVRLEENQLDRTSPLKEALGRYAPDQMLSFSVLRVNWHAGVERLLSEDMVRYRSDLSVTLELSVGDAQADRTIWRASGFYYVLPRPEDTADQFVDQLITAGFLKPAPLT